MTQKETSKIISFPGTRRARKRVGGELAHLRAEALREKFRKADNFSAKPGLKTALKRGFKTR